MNINEIKDAIRDIPDFPQKGIIFKDITPILGDPHLFTQSIDAFAQSLEGIDFDKIAGIDARGFIFGAALAQKLGKGFIPIRKAGKLPYETIATSYDLEYGQATVEIHKDALKPGEKALLIDDLLATGGTAKAAIDLLEKLQVNIVAIRFLIELSFLGGKDALGGYDTQSLITY